MNTYKKEKTILDKFLLLNTCYTFTGGVIMGLNELFITKKYNAGALPVENLQCNIHSFRILNFQLVNFIKNNNFNFNNTKISYSLVSDFVKDIKLKDYKDLQSYIKSNNIEFYDNLYKNNYRYKFLTTCLIFKIPVTVYETRNTNSVYIKKYFSPETYTRLGNSKNISQFISDTAFDLRPKFIYTSFLITVLDLSYKYIYKI